MRADSYDLLLQSVSGGLRERLMEGRRRRESRGGQRWKQEGKHPDEPFSGPETGPFSAWNF